MITEDDIPEHWRVGSLEDVITRIKGGYSGSQNEDGVGCPVTRIETIATGEIDPTSTNHVDIENNEYKKHIMEIGDILFSNINSPSHIGKTAIYQGNPPELIHGMNLILIRPDKGVILPGFLKYILQWYYRVGFFESFCKHAINQASLAQKDIKPVSIPIPPLKEQKHIVSVLDAGFASLERVTELSEQMTECSEEFINSLSYHTFNPEEVPDDWSVTTLGEVGDFRNGKYLPKKDMDGGEFTVYGSNGAIGSHSEFWVENPCIAIGRVGSCGEVNRVEDDAWISDNAIVFWPTDINYEYAFQFLSKYDFDHLISQAAQPLIRQGDVKDIEIPLPPRAEQNRVAEQLFNAEKIQMTVGQKTKGIDLKQSTLKKSMLSKAFSGQLTF